ncbi:hypothetical protein [Galbibacter pacificus]|uniref:Uncharacterized protein n=1 Tax=Galbibacter pacificus TaxID=2996052 RepID=A0ABT6FTQ9_9FLAO|nr:hypothetical protein [Galbibacter pacificus]MDG3582433.1 hypothetical protein [Galbibacter pacificus]MDG3586449.1 hypothetical protein [Galbibacter pacificus]
MGNGKLYGQDGDMDNQWDFLIEPYIMFSNMSGHLGVGVIPPVEVDVEPDDIFSSANRGHALS